MAVCQGVCLSEFSRLLGNFYSPASVAYSGDVNPGDFRVESVRFAPASHDLPGGSFNLNPAILEVKKCLGSLQGDTLLLRNQADELVMAVALAKAKICVEGRCVHVEDAFGGRAMLRQSSVPEAECLTEELLQASVLWSEAIEALQTCMTPQVETSAAKSANALLVARSEIPNRKAQEDSNEESAKTEKCAKSVQEFRMKVQSKESTPQKKEVNATGKNPDDDSDDDEEEQEHEQEEKEQEEADQKEEDTLQQSAEVQLQPKAKQVGIVAAVPPITNFSQATKMSDKEREACKPPLLAKRCTDPGPQVPRMNSTAGKEFAPAPDMFVIHSNRETPRPALRDGDSRPVDPQIRTVMPQRLNATPREWRQFSGPACYTNDSPTKDATTPSTSAGTTPRKSWANNGYGVWNMSAESLYDNL